MFLNSGVGPKEERWCLFLRTNLVRWIIAYKNCDMRVVYTFFEGACSVFCKISCGHRVDFEKNVRKVRPHSHFYLGSKFSIFLHFQFLFSQALCTPDTSYLPGKVTPALETSQVAHILYISICSIMPSDRSFVQRNTTLYSRNQNLLDGHRFFCSKPV